MKKFTKILCLAMALMMCAVTLSACSSSKLFPDAKDTFCIGATGPLTGENASYGISVQRGAQIAIKEINEELGGLNGIKFSFEMIDDVAAPDKAATGYTSLIEAGMQLSIGSVTSGACKAFGDAAKEDNLILITPSASADNVIGTGDHAFRVCFGDPQQGEMAAETLSAEYKKIGVIYDKSDAYSQGLYDAFEAKMTSLNKVKDTDYFVITFDASSKDTFVTNAVDTLKGKGCDVLFLPFYYEAAGKVAMQAAKTEYNVPIFGCDGLDGIAGQIDDTVKATVSYITPFDVNSTDAAVKKFVDAYKAEFDGELPDQFAADGYDAVMILYAAMKEANIDDVDMTASELTEALKPILTGGTFKYSGVTGKDMTWDKSGSCNKAANIVEVK